VGFQDAIRRATARAACNLVGPGIPGSLYDFTSIGLVFPGQLEAFREWVCDFPGNEEDKGQIRPGSPGLGGKCPVLYDMNILVTRSLSFGGTTTIEIPWSATGPISNLRIASSGGNNSQVLLDAADGVNVVNSESVDVIQNISAEFLSITRRDGQPDNCGFIEPPEPPSWDDEIPDDDPENPPRPINIVPIIPVVLPGGGLSFPFTINGPNFTFNTTVRIGRGGAGGGGGNGECEPIEPIFGPEIQDGPIIPEEPLTEEEQGEELPNVLLGVIITGNRSGTGTTATEIFQFSAPNIWAPRLANVTFRFRIGDLLVWGSDIPVKNLNTFIPAPGPFAAVGVAITPIPGFNLSILPVYRQVDGFIIEE